MLLRDTALVLLGYRIFTFISHKTAWYFVRNTCLMLKAEYQPKDVFLFSASWLFGCCFYWLIYTQHLHSFIQRQISGSNPNPFFWWKNVVDCIGNRRGLSGAAPYKAVRQVPTPLYENFWICHWFISTQTISIHNFNSQF